MTLPDMLRAPSALCQAIGLLKIEHPVGNAEAGCGELLEFERALVA